MKIQLPLDPHIIAIVCARLAVLARPAEFFLNTEDRERRHGHRDGDQKTAGHCQAPLPKRVAGKVKAMAYPIAVAASAPPPSWENAMVEKSPMAPITISAPAYAEQMRRVEYSWRGAVPLPAPACRWRPARNAMQPRQVFRANNAGRLRGSQILTGVVHLPPPIPLDMIPGAMRPCRRHSTSVAKRLEST